LSFNRTPFFCVVPWLSVYALVGDDGRGMVWPENVPPEVASQARSREGDGAAAAKRAGPRRVAGPATSPATQDASTTKSPPAGESAADGAGGKSKKPKKRLRSDTPATREREGGEAPPARANLVAVPSSPSSPASTSGSASPAARRPQALPQRIPRVSTSGAETPPGSAAQTPPRPEQPAPGVIQAERRPNAAPRPKRELPPYLRVVK